MLSYIQPFDVSYIIYFNPCGNFKLFYPGFGISKTILIRIFFVYIDLLTVRSNLLKMCYIYYFYKICLKMLWVAN